MIILHLYDNLNGHRYRKFTYAYYVRNILAHASYVVESWIVPGTLIEEIV